jgi:cell wall-associated NlpC family hydrolase
MSSSRRTATAISALTGALCAGGVVAVLVTGPTSASAATGNPVGLLESATVSTTHVTVTGWAADPSSTASIRVAVIRDGGTVTTVMANLRRDDIALEFPKFGRWRGYTATVTVPAGTHTVCVRAANVGPGTTTQLGCAPVTVAGTPVRPVLPVATRPPFGYLDQASYASGKLTLSGWSVDPDTTAATIVDVSVGGVRLASSIANLDRPDVALAFPRYGRRHGFVVTVPMTAPSLHFSACVIALNTGAGPSKQVSCRLVSATPSYEPAVLNTATAASAAIAMQAEAIASGAARLSEFPPNASSGARIAVAARALLEQATGHRAPPKPKAGVPAFQVVTPAKPVDEQAVMGPTPNLGSYPQVRNGGRAGSSRGPAVFHNDSLPEPSSAGVGMAGAARALPVNGTTVRPVLPDYRAGVVRVRAEIAVSAALRELGLPYVFAAAGPKTFDCSGLTMWAWARAGAALDHYTGTQAHQGVRIQRNQLLPGDLMLFGGDVHHVGMYLGAGYMINAPYTGAYVRIAKLTPSSDLSLAVRP